jgi:CotH kinase protein
MKKIVLAIFIPLLLLIGGFMFASSLKNDTIVFDGEPIPIVSIKSVNEIQDEPKTQATIEIKLRDSVVFKADIGIEIRGAVSQMMSEKKSFGFEIWDSTQNGESKPVMGMPAGEDWILYGPYLDKTLIKNALAYQLSNDLGKYAPKTQFVDLKVNDEYKGLYVMMEKIKRGKNRVNIARQYPNDSTDVSGGYILKLDKTVGKGENDIADYTSQNSFRSMFNEKGVLSQKSKTHFLFDYPKEKEITQKQKNYITKYVLNFEKSLAASTFSDPELGFRKYIDEDSFIDYLILTELMRNHDGYRISTYLQKEAGEKLKMGPLWDCDLAFGEGSFCGGLDNSKNDWVFNYNKSCSDDTWLVPFWWKRLLQDKSFTQKLQTRWATLRKNELSDATLMNLINNQSKYLQNTKAAERNSQLWGTKSLFSNRSKDYYEKEINELKSWLKNRTAWIDVNILKL